MLTLEQLLDAIPFALSSVELEDFGAKIEGKVRDSYRFEKQRVLITTDRVSAFDRVLGLIPYKGQVLNQLSLWWFEQTQDIVPNHVIGSPDVNVTIAREAKPLPVEVVVRGYITGVTSTSMWTLYEQGDRQPYGITLPDGLKKNDPLPHPVITPTTKAVGGAHDEGLTREQVLERRLVEPSLWDQVERAAIALFERGQEIARNTELILVDTKYEYGLIDGHLVLIDEIHTPDSSRYWTVESLESGDEPEHYDKEYLRKWYAGQGYRGEGDPPKMPAEFVATVAERYIAVFERLTGRDFVPGTLPAAERIANTLRQYRDENKIQDA